MKTTRLAARTRSRFVADVAQQFGIKKATIEQILAFFRGRTPLLRIHRETGVPMKVIGKIWTMPWRPILDDIQADVKQPRRSKANAAVVEPALVEQVQALMELQVAGEDIRNYLGITEDLLQAARGKVSSLG